MRIPTLVDAVAIAPAAILGLLGVWLGFARLLVIWPMRWLIPLFAAGAAALPAMLYLAVNGRVADLLRPSGTAAMTAAAAVSFLVTLVPLRMFMSNLKERVAVWTGQRRIGFMERAFGALVGIACGILLVAIAFAYTPMRRTADGEPSWVRESVLLPYFRSAADAVTRTLLPYLPYPDGPAFPGERKDGSHAAFDHTAGAQDSSPT